MLSAYFGFCIPATFPPPDWAALFKCNKGGRERIPGRPNHSWWAFTVYASLGFSGMPPSESKIFVMASCEVVNPFDALKDMDQV